MSFFFSKFSSASIVTATPVILPNHSHDRLSLVIVAIGLRFSCRFTDGFRFSDSYDDEWVGFFSLRLLSSTVKMLQFNFLVLDQEKGLCVYWVT